MRVSSLVKGGIEPLLNMFISFLSFKLEETALREIFLVQVIRVANTKNRYLFYYSLKIERYLINAQGIQQNIQYSYLAAPS